MELFHRSRWALVVLILCSFTNASHAQDSHYWTHQYGTSAQLLGGAVAGSVRDLSATFYNPGALVFVGKANFIMATDAFEVVGMKIENATGPGLDL